MELYEKALFEAFVWTQAIESEVHDLILNCADDGRLKLHHEQCDKLGELTLGRLIEKVKSMRRERSLQQTEGTQPYAERSPSTTQTTWKI